LMLKWAEQSVYVGIASGLSLVLMLCVIFTLFPFIGYSLSLRKKQRNRLS
jgi:hypothetical protein